MVWVGLDVVCGGLVVVGGVSTDPDRSYHLIIVIMIIIIL